MKKHNLQILWFLILKVNFLMSEIVKTIFEKENIF